MWKVGDKVEVHFRNGWQGGTIVAEVANRAVVHNDGGEATNRWEAADIREPQAPVRKL